MSQLQGVALQCGAGAGIGVVPSHPPKFARSILSRSLTPCSAAAPIFGGCTCLPGVHPSLGTAPNFGSCTCFSGCAHLLGCTYLGGAVLIPWDTAVFRACTHLLGCAYLRGLHPSLGAVSQDAPIFPGVHPSPGATTIFWCASIFRVCTHLSGCKPSLGVAPLSKGCSPLLLGTHLQVLVGALAAVQGSAGMPRLLSWSLGVSPCPCLQSPVPIG